MVRFSHRTNRRSEGKKLMINAAEQFQQTVTDDCKLSTVIYSVDQRKKKEWESLIVFSVGGGGGGVGGGGGGVMVVVVMVVV